jgi:hypothetical protein
MLGYLTNRASAAGRAEAAADHQEQRYPAAAEAPTPRRQQALVMPRLGAGLRSTSQLMDLTNVVEDLTELHSPRLGYFGRRR